MTIDKAIKTLRLMITYWPPSTTNTQFSSILLGIEALKLIQRERLLGINPVETELPGETKE